ncbi:MAG: DUF2283 domain-containing protein [Nanoarchaeota archaeon]
MEKHYDSEEDILDIQFSDKPYWKSIELPNGVVLDISKDGDVIAMEIIKASKVLAKSGKEVIEAAKVASV